MNKMDAEKFYKESWNINVYDKDGDYDTSYKHCPIEMINFAEKYHQSKVNNGVLDDVSQQRELLIGLVKYINDYQDYLKGKEFEEVVKEYLSHINCG